MPAVLVDREDALHVSGGAPEGLLDCITDGPLRGRAIQPREAFRGAVVDGQDEAEIGRPAQPACVFGERSLDRLLVAPEGRIAVANAEEFPPLAALQALLPVRDVADLLGHLVRVSVVPSLHEEHCYLPSVLAFRMASCSSRSASERSAPTHQPRRIATRRAVRLR